MWNVVLPPQPKSEQRYEGACDSPCSRVMVCLNTMMAQPMAADCRIAFPLSHPMVVIELILRAPTCSRLIANGEDRDQAIPMLKYFLGLLNQSDYL